MENLFLFEFVSPLWLLFRFLSLIGASVVLIWLFNTAYMHFFYKSDKDVFTLTLKFSLLKSFIALVLFISVYLFFLIKVNGLHWFLWKQFPLSIFNIYFLLAPEIFLLIGVISLFYYQKSQINKLIK